MTPASRYNLNHQNQTSVTRVPVERLNNIVTKLLNEKEWEMKNKVIDEILLSDHVICDSLLEEHFIYSDQGVWKLTPKGTIYADSVQMIRKSRFYMILVPAVCLISILLAVISLFY